MLIHSSDVDGFVEHIILVAKRFRR